jgi:electron transport complex protein RnfB
VISDKSIRSPTLSLIDTINALLPQTQCTRCGHQGCKPYAQAIVEGDAINKCPPGGALTIQALSGLLGTEALALDPFHGTEGPRKVAVIREAECIGCTKCIQACPVDAILGGGKLMHTVIESECTGCDLCVEPCPVDCIDMVPVQSAPDEWEDMRRRAVHYKSRYDFRETRLAAAKNADEQRRAERAALVMPPPDATQDPQADAKATIAAALERVRAKKALQQPANTSPQPPREHEQQ